MNNLSWLPVGEIFRMANKGVNIWLGSVSLHGDTAPPPLLSCHCLATCRSQTSAGFQACVLFYAVFFLWVSFLLKSSRFLVCTWNTSTFEAVLCWRSNPLFHLHGALLVDIFWRLLFLCWCLLTAVLFLYIRSRWVGSSVTSCPGCLILYRVCRRSWNFLFSFQGNQ